MVMGSRSGMRVYHAGATRLSKPILKIKNPTTLQSSCPDRVPLFFLSAHFLGAGVGGGVFFTPK